MLVSRAMSMPIARGVGPRWFRGALAGLATLYGVALLVHPPNRGVLRPLAFFTSATCLFPRADRYATEFRLAAWSCDTRAWEPLDPRPYFPIEADDKESRLQRLAYFYKANRTVMRALDDYLVAHHDGRADGVAGAIGGIRLVEDRRELPPVGEAFPRYVFDPRAPLAAPDPAHPEREPYHTPGRLHADRCRR